MNRRSITKMTSTSREFEELVANIERSMSHKDVRVVSPDFLVDKVTGGKREVDASIRYSVGSAEILVTIECRKRSRAQDVTWIEQLATKRLQVGADKTIAVASSDFSDAAKKAATHHGIALRKISEINNIESLLTTDQLEVQIVSVDISIEIMKITFSQQGLGDVQLNGQSHEAWRNQVWDAKIFSGKEPERKLSLSDLIDASRGNLLDEIGELPVDGSLVKKTISIAVEDEIILAETDAGQLEVKRIDLQLSATKKVENIVPKSAGSYVDVEKSSVITNYSTRNLELVKGGKYRVFSLSKKSQQ